MKLNRKLVLILALLVSIAMATTGTLAYLSDTDADVNVMTLGSVYIVQNEQERTADGELVPFTQNKPAYPAVGPIEWATEGVDVNGTKYKVFTDELKNVIDKIVTVTNTGKSDAFVRTIVAIEAPEYDPNDLIHINYNGTDVTSSAPISFKDGNVDYVALAFTYADALKAGQTSAPSLVQLFLDSKATNEDIAEFGDTWEIKVLSQAVQTAGFADAMTALDAAFGELSVTNVTEWFGGDLSIGSPSDPDIIPLPEGWPSNNPPKLIDASTWQEVADTSWYNDTDTEFTLKTPEHLAGLAKLVDGGNNFEGKTIKQSKNIDLLAMDENGKRVLFDPIGSYRKDTAFKGTFDGQGHTISNMSQNTWALNNGYYYGDLGLGLFGKVEDATIKNLIMDDASISGESAICGTVAATAYGDCTFENITVKNSNVADYQYYAGGVVGWASGNHQYIGITIDDSVTIGGQWGDFGNANGGIIGGAGGNATILMKDCTVACRIDAVNDVVSAYQWYCYRNSGMLIGNTNHKATDEAVTNAAAPNLTCENVTVIYGDWANYTYCEFAGTGYPFVRVQAGTSVDAYSNVRYGHPTDAAGNTVVNDNHVHNDGEKHHELIAFDQLYGGNAQHRFCTYGTATHDGVKVIYNNK